MHFPRLCPTRYRSGPAGVVVLIASALLVLTACTSGSSGSSPEATMTVVGASEGKLSILAWPGYVEDGHTDPKVDWVTPFEQQTHCQVDFKPFNTSDEAVTAMHTGQYDVVSASGDASLRLVAAGDVQPINTSLVPNYADVYPFLKDKAWNTVDGKNYGVPHGWGANLLMYRTDQVNPAPTSWDAVFDKSGEHAGKVTAYDSPIYIADAAVYLMAHQPELGIKNPYALDEKQFQAAVDLLKAQRPDVGDYWSDITKEVQAFKDGASVVGTTWQVGANSAVGEQVPVATVLPSEGATGWSDTWMISSKSKNQNCAYKWLDYIISPDVNAKVAEFFGESPSNTKACNRTVNRDHCAIYHSGDTDYASRIWYWTTPVAQCLDGRTDVTCKDYAAWTQAWRQIKG